MVTARFPGNSCLAALYVHTATAGRGIAKDNGSMADLGTVATHEKLSFNIMNFESWLK